MQRPRGFRELEICRCAELQVLKSRMRDFFVLLFELRLPGSGPVYLGGGFCLFTKDRLMMVFGVAVGSYCLQVQPARGEITALPLSRSPRAVCSAFPNL